MGDKVAQKEVAGLTAAGCQLQAASLQLNTILHLNGVNLFHGVIKAGAAKRHTAFAG